jgi:tol-pal system protein YbgF
MTGTSTFKALAFVVAVSAAPGVAAAQSDSPFSFFDRMFRGNSADANAPAAAPEESQRLAQNAPTDLVVRIDRLEAQIRQLTGVIEQLQHRNQQLELQLRRMQEASGGPQPPSPMMRQSSPGGVPLPPPAGSSGLPPAAGSVLPPVSSSRRSDAFDPSQNPNAPGAPQSLGTLSGGAPPSTVLAQPPGGEPPIGAPGGRQAGSPLDLTTIGGNQANLGTNAANDPGAPQTGALPPPPARNPSSTGAVAAVLPPSATPRDQYDLGYGYVLRKDYALAEEAFQTFLSKYPKDKLVPDAQFWLGESRFQRQRYDAAAEAFLVVSTKHTGNPKAPEAMLRLGQSLAQLGQREMACATLAEVGKKFPRASSSVRQGVEREKKRVRC